MVMDFADYPSTYSPENWLIWDLDDGDSEAIRLAAGPDREYFDTWFPGEGERIYELPYPGCGDDGGYVEIEWPW